MQNKKLKFKEGDIVFYVNPYYDSNDVGFGNLVGRKVIITKVFRKVGLPYDYCISGNIYQEIPRHSANDYDVREGELAPLTEIAEILFSHE